MKKAAALVAAGILPAVEGGVSPSGLGARISRRCDVFGARSAGRDARLYGRQDAQDACRYFGAPQKTL